MPEIFGLITIKYNTPMLSVIFSVGLSFWIHFELCFNETTVSSFNSLKKGFLGLIYIFMKDIYTLLNMAMVVFFINHIATIIALLRLRCTMPNEKRPIRVNFILKPILF